MEGDNFNIKVIARINGLPKETKGALKRSASTRSPLNKDIETLTPRSVKFK